MLPMKINFKLIFKIVTYIFAIIGVVFTVVFIAMQFGWLNVRGANSTRNASLGITSTNLNSCGNKSICYWNDAIEWGVLRDAFTKDKGVIDRVARETGVHARMIVAVTAPEQLRYFTSNRESFKKYFEPLKILSSLSKFSLGVSGIKEDTAKQIEIYANDPTSEFYPGDRMASLVAYTTTDSHDTALYNRLTDAHDHYYSYLYTALYIKEIEAQWQRAGFDVSHKPEVLVTLFNLGFDASHPNAHPEVAGSDITLGGHTYSYGELGTLFYNSSELTTVFPK